MTIEPGEVFTIKTNIGYGFLQFIQMSNLGIEIIRVLEPIKQKNQITQEEVNILERYSVQFVVKTALRRKLIERAGKFQIPNQYHVPIKGRTEHIIRGEFIGWHIVDQQTLKRELKTKLTNQDILLSPHGHPNDTLLREWLESNWRLENWK